MSSVNIAFLSGAPLYPIEESPKNCGARFFSLFYFSVCHILSWVLGCSVCYMSYLSAWPITFSWYPGGGGGPINGRRPTTGATCGIAAGRTAASCRCADISKRRLFRLLAHASFMYTNAPPKTTKKVRTSNRFIPFALVKDSPEILKIPMFSLLLVFVSVFTSSAIVEDFDPIVKQFSKTLIISEYPVSFSKCLVSSVNKRKSRRSL